MKDLLQPGLVIGDIADHLQGVLIQWQQSTNPLLSVNENPSDAPPNAEAERSVSAWVGRLRATGAASDAAHDSMKPS